MSVTAGPFGDDLVDAEILRTLHFRWQCPDCDAVHRRAQVKRRTRPLKCRRCGARWAIGIVFNRVTGRRRFYRVPYDTIVSESGWQPGDPVNLLISKDQG